MEQKVLSLIENIKLKKNFIKELLLLFILGSLTSLSLPPFNLFIINFFTFSIFFGFLFKKLDQKIKKIFFHLWLVFRFRLFFNKFILGNNIFNF